MGMKNPNIISKTPAKISKNSTPKLLSGNISSKKAPMQITKNATSKSFIPGAIRIPSLKI